VWRLDHWGRSVTDLLAAYGVGLDASLQLLGFVRSQGERQAACSLTSPHFAN
jgi:hypothetical protein